MAESGKVRKSTAQEFGVEQILKKIDGVSIFQERMTQEGIMKQMAEPKATTGGSLNLDGTVYLFAPELTMMLPGDEISRKVMGFLTSIYMGKDHYSRPLTSGTGHIEISNALVNFLGATAPDWLETIGEDVAKGGFLARMIFITADKRKKDVAWPKPPIGGVTIQSLVEDLQEIAAIKGQIIPTPRLIKAFEDWYCTKRPDHDDPRIQGFRERSHDLALRLAMLLTVASSDDLILDEPALQLAITLIHEIEQYVPAALSHIGTSTQSREADRILKQLQRHGGKMTRAELSRLNSWKMKISELDEVIQQLMTNQVIIMERQGKSIYYVIK